MKKMLSILLCIVLMSGLCACAEAAPAKPDPAKTVKTAVKIMHYGNYSDIYAALRKAREKSAGYGGGGIKNNMTAAVADTAAAPGKGAAAPEQTASPDYSATNVQVKGVDEGDIVKTDGKYIYALKDNELLVYKPDGANTKLASRLTVSTSDSAHPEELYVSGDRLAVVLATYRIYNATVNSANIATPDIARPMSEKVSVAIYDISNPEAPKVLTTLGQDGSFLNSRMLNGKLYLVTNYYVYGDGAKEGDPKTFAPCTYVNDTATAMPAKSIAILPVVPQSSYAVVCAYDLEGGLSAGSLSILGGGSTLYMNSENLYLADTEYGDTASAERKQSVYTVVDHVCSNTTTITAVSLSGLTAAACGTVPGTLCSSYSMDEYKGNLRVATTNNSYSYSVYTDKTMGFENYKYPNDNKTVNALYVLDSGMNIVGRAENIAPGETIQSARFDGADAYLCTFEQTDPLFAYDLSNPKSPVKLGEMKITGFSDYLHVWADGRLFGLGQSATEKGQVTGMKMVMFDVSDKANVSVKTSLDLGDGYSQALYDPNAILVSPDKSLIGFPTDTGYVLYSYSDGVGFKKLASITGSDWDSNMRGLYIDDYLYIVGQGGVTVIDMASYGVVSTVKV